MRIFKTTGRGKNLLPKDIVNNMDDFYTLTLKDNNIFIATNQNSGQSSKLVRIKPHDLNKLFKMI